jgi:hypothetical protein
MDAFILSPTVLLDVLPKVTNRGAACILSSKSSVSMKTFDPSSPAFHVQGPDTALLPVLKRVEIQGLK